LVPAAPRVPGRRPVVNCLPSSAAATWGSRGSAAARPAGGGLPAGWRRRRRPR